MVEPLSERDIKRWEATQQWEKFRRRQFLFLNKPTQHAIVDILVKAEEIVHSKNETKAQIYISRTIWAKKHRDRAYNFITDNKGVDWSEVYEHIIKGGCFSDHDMEGLRLIAHKLASEITVFRNLMELEPPEEEMF